jgi:hypothetical protein
MRTLSILFSFMILFGCSTSKKSNQVFPIGENKIIDIREYNSVFVLKTINESTLDTSFILSPKRNFFRKQKLKEPFNDNAGKSIIMDKSYYFKVSTVRFRANAMENLGLYIVFDNDTIWRGQKAPTRKYYLSKNSIGLFIHERN